MRLPTELYKPIFTNIHDKHTLVCISTLSKCIQPSVEAILWNKFCLLRTFRNNNPCQTTKVFDLVRRRTGKYVKRLEFSLWYLVQWVTWDRSESEGGLKGSVERLIWTFNAMPNVERARLLDMDEQSAPDELACILSAIGPFPRLKQVYYLGSLSDSFIDFLHVHCDVRTLFIGSCVSNRAHSFTESPRPCPILSRRYEEKPLLPNLRALETTTPLIHVLLPLLDGSNSQLSHLTISFEHHGADAYIESQIMHLELQNRAYFDFGTAAQESTTTNARFAPPNPLIFPSVHTLRLDKLVDSHYASAFSALLPRFPNVVDIGNALLSPTSIPNLLPTLPLSLEKIHFKYEGIMWDAEFGKLRSTVKERCSKMRRVEVWAWSEAYYDFWGCRWEGDGLDVKEEEERVSYREADGGQVWNVKMYGYSVMGNPAVLWI